MSMVGVYIVLGVGMFIAFITLIAEIYWKRRVKQKLINKFPRWVTKKFHINISKLCNAFILCNT